MEELKELFQEAGRRSPEALTRPEHYYDIELTYTSNAIERNTLSAVETTLVIEKGIAIGGKPLRDHLEALDHYDAIRYARELGRHETPVTESDVRNLHRPTHISVTARDSRPDKRFRSLAGLRRQHIGRSLYSTHAPGGYPPLIRSGYPPISVRPEYTRALEREQSGQGTNDFNALLYRRLDAPPADCLSSLT